MGVQVGLLVRASRVAGVEDRSLVSVASVEVIDHSIYDLWCLSGVHDCFRGPDGRGSKSRVDCLVRRSKKSEGPPRGGGPSLNSNKGGKNGNKQYGDFVVAVV